ncbi:MAG: 3-ketoacyl-ACP reductase [Phycisphaerales bacterium]|nr:3-ketoacyl-ACP reductase [Phycisphaerales bacterium]
MAIASSPVALVTGAGQGIGRGIARQLANDGFLVVINDVVADPAVTDKGPYEVKATIEKAGGKAGVFKADISSRSDRQAMVDYIEQTFGRFDLLVNNAGVAPKERKDILDASEESYDRLMTINAKGPYFLTQLVANKMIAHQKAGTVKTPRIAFITSISAYTSSTFRGEYCTSKAAVAMAATLWADRLGEFGIPVLQFSPGIIATPMTSVVQAKYDKMIAEGILVTRRWGQPEDLALAVAAFAKGYLDYSTGNVIEVGGGFGMKRL